MMRWYPDAIVYPNVYRYTYDPEGEHKYFDNILRGLDFGFAPDPTAYIDMHYDKTHNDIYLLNEVYDYRLTSQQIYNAVVQKWHSYGPVTCEIDKRVIEELTQAGLYAKSVDVARLNAQAAMNLYSAQAVQKQVELTQSTTQANELAPVKQLENNRNIINLFNISDKNSNSQNGFNPFQNGEEPFS